MKYLALVVIIITGLFFGGCISNSNNLKFNQPNGEEVLATLETTQGIIKLKLFPDVAPMAVENFIVHIQNGYYDNLIFHRIIKDFMIQGGDPTGTGRGGESIWKREFVNEHKPNIVFNRPFLLAMANKGPNTNGSQFFITTKETPFLNGGYTIFGEVIEGKNVVRQLEKVKTDKNDRPLVQQIIKKAKSENYFETRLYNKNHNYSKKKKFEKFIKDQNGCLHKRLYDIDFRISWTGQCKNGYADGYGKEIWKRASDNVQTVVYEGVLKKALRHGKGKELSRTTKRRGSILGGYDEACDVHIGLWYNGKKHGKGRYESHHKTSCDNLVYSYDGNSHSLEGSWNNGYRDGEYIQQFFGSKTLYKKTYNQGKFISSHRINGNILNDISHAIGKSAGNTSSYDSSSSSNNCSSIEKQCKNNCSSMSNKHVRECRSKCSDAYYSCKQGDTKAMSRNICKSQCVTRAGGSMLDLQYSEKIKCFRSCK